MRHPFRAPPARTPRVFLFCTALLLLLGIGTGAVAWRAPSATVALSSAADTTVIFGPKRLDAAPGTANYVEQFTETHDASARYVLEVTNGASDGGSRVSEATVKVNGIVVLTPTDFQSTETVLKSEVWIADGTNTIQAEVSGTATRFLTLRVLRIRTAGAPLYRRYFQKGTEQTVTIVDTFSTGSSRDKPGRMEIESGAEDDHVYLNGVRIFPSCIPDTLNECVAEYVRHFDVTLQPVNELRVVLSGPAPSTLALSVVAIDTAAPALQIAGPAEGLVTNDLSVEVAGTVLDETPPVTLVIGGDTVPVGSGGAFAKTVQLASEGENLIHIVAEDAAVSTNPFEVLDPEAPSHNRVEVVRRVIRDTRAPVLALSAPAGEGVVREATVAVQGSVTDAMAVTVNVNGVPFSVDASGSFSGAVTLAEGVNFVTATATDLAGNSASVTRQVTVDTQGPAITLTSPAEGLATSLETVEVQGSVSDRTLPSVRVNGVEVPVSPTGTFGYAVALQVGDNTILVTAADALGNTSTLSRTVRRRGADVDLPPDPVDVAPAIDPNGPATVGASTAFLYEGANPIQTGVQPGTIHAERAAVVRGRVLTRQGQPLAGARVEVQDHPELGQTLSREDGAYDLAVNGGGTLVLLIEKEGYLPALRRVEPAWQQFTQAAEAVLVAVDPRVTLVELTASTPEAQVARGSVVTDASGARQTTIIFDPGTAAVLEMPDGSTRPVASLNVRATEYTVGAAGPAAMPGPLPPTSAYTYAVELSADEAMAAGAEHVRFTKPVAVYVENFLGFPVGTPVPVGYLECRRCGAWVPEPNGRVIRIVSVADEVAQVDTDGDGLADGDAVLAGYGIDLGERRRLAGLYTPGQTLWRMQVSHFSAIDGNFPSGPDEKDPKNKADKNKDRDKDCERSGSIIECRNQVLGERVPVSGTGLTLNYRSRQPGRLVDQVVDISLSGDTIPETLLRIELEVQVAGSRYVRTFQPAPNLRHRFTWDGRDGYGRPVGGNHAAVVAVGYVYRQYYLVPADEARSFGLSCTGPAAGDRWTRERCILPSTLGTRGAATRQEETSWHRYGVTMGNWDPRVQGLGGWTLSVHHAYDRASRTLMLGNGERKSADPLSQGGARTLVGTGIAGYNGDNIPATRAQIRYVASMAYGPDGSLYLADSNDRIRKVDPKGIITTVAGSGIRGWAGDGGPATAAQLNVPTDVAVSPDGSLVIADWKNNRIRKVTPDGVMHTVAGTGAACPVSTDPCGDGGPATEAMFDEPSRVAVGADCSIYVADRYNHRVRKISPDGTITTVAGTGAAGFAGDGGPAKQAVLNVPNDVEIHPDGSLLIMDVYNNRIRKVTPDGIITTIAGVGYCRYDQVRCGDGGPATSATFRYPNAIEVAPDGTIYVAETGDEYVRKISPEGIISTVAGRGTYGDEGPDGSPATAVEFRDPIDLVVAPDGGLAVADYGNFRIRRFVPALPAGAAGDISVASDDGSELYRFDAAGRHRSTVDALTGAVRFTFAYDAEARLATVTDGDGRVTRVERSASGAPAAVVSPRGERTTLSVDGNGYLASVADAAGEVRMEYAPGGMLAAFGAPGRLARFAYDAEGRLTGDASADGRSQTLTRQALPNGYQVSVATAMGRTSVYRVESLPSGGERETNTDPAGIASVFESLPDGSSTLRRPDGSILYTTAMADPRFGMQAPRVQRRYLRTPAGLGTTVTTRRSVELADPSNPTSVARWTDTVEVNGRMAVRSYDAQARRYLTVTPTGRRMTTRVDERGRVVEEVRPGTLPLAYAYDSAGNLASVVQGQRSWSYTYDGQRLATSRDPLGRVTRYTYDAAGLPASRLLPGGRTVGYGWAPGGIASLTPPGRLAHVWERGASGKVTAYTAPQVGAAPSTTRFHYDLDQYLTRVERADGRAVQFAYDAGGRSSTMTLDGQQVQYAYDPRSGALASVTAPGSILRFTYDGFLPLTSAWSGEVAGTVTLGYNTDFRVATESVNGAGYASFTYDPDGLVTQAGDLRVDRAAESGRITGTQIGTVSTAYAYNGYGEPAELRAASGSASLFSAAYQRDTLGRITELSETAGGRSTGWSYAYDAAGRLATVLRGGAPFAAYEYDANGNRVREAGPAGVLTGTYDAQDRLVSYGDETFQYAPEGELVARISGGDTTRFAYDAAGRLTSATLPGGRRVDYLLDGGGRRIGRRVDGILRQGFLYRDRFQLVAELDSAGGMASRFVYGTRKYVPDYMIRAGATYRFVTDHLGSIRQVVNTATGTVVQEIEYDPFGKVISDSNPGFQPFSYAGGILDRATGLLRFGFRDYDPRTGRWTTKDPLGIAGSGTNLYAYVGNDPVNASDPSGLTPLSDCLKEFFGEMQPWMFPNVDLDRINIREGSPGLPPRGADAITLGNDIFFRGGAYDPCSADGVALIAHELQHVQQNSADPNQSQGQWYLDYLLESALQRLLGNDPYLDNWYEKNAQDIENSMRDHIKKLYGDKGPCPGDCAGKK